MNDRVLHGGSYRGGSAPRRLIAAILGAAWCTVVAASPSAARTPSEDELRALFLYRFTQLIAWPASVLGGPEDAFTICGLGADPLDGEIEKAVDGRRSHDRTLAVRWIDDVEDIGSCHALYIRAEDPVTIERTLERLDGSPVLTVGDALGFAERGGMIELRKVDRHIRFEINRGAAERAGLAISTRLLGYASTVRP